jgi:large subunit ribosomal protein L6
MSRVGKQPVIIPQGVKAAVQNNVVLIEGPKGKLSFTPARGIKAVLDSGKIIVSPTITEKDSKGKEFIPDNIKAIYGTARAIINNMVLGVTKGWKRSLEMNGVGFGAKVQGQNLTLSVGFSHDVVIVLPKEVKCTITKNTIELESADREVIGTLAAKIRRVQPPEPYLGKGIKYTEETIRRKAGKAGKK